MTLRSVFKLIAVNLGLLLAGAVGLELIFGDWFKDGLASLNVQRDYEIRYSAKGLYEGAGEIVYERDRFGFRGAYGHDPAQIELLTIGGSTANQIYLPQDQTWQAVLGRALDIRIASAAIDGQSSIGHLAAFERWFPQLPNLRPKWVLAYVGLNDILVGDSANADRLEHFPSLQHHIRRKSALYRLIQTAKGMAAANKGRMVHHKVDFENAVWTTQPTRHDWPQARAQALEAYKGRVRALIGQTRALGAQPILVTQRHGDWRLRPDGAVEGIVEPGAATNGVDHRLLMGLYNKATLEVCRAEAAICLDLASKLEFEPGDFYDLVHNTPAGAARIGQWLALELKDVVKP
ncbi:MAG: GDSL-type esterase/lipase family protein [Rhodospirillales bacterium]|nr:GDSL-type esterase/lipase family protein [Rhodospirillales bacterium]